jgi:hypothetical protein
MKLMVVALVGLVVGCGAGPDMMLMTMTDVDAGGQLPDAALTPDTSPGPGPKMDAAAPKTDTAPPADRQMAATAPPPAPECGRPAGFTVNRCGYNGGPSPNGGNLWVPKWKEGRECAVCTVGGSVVTGCLAAREPDEYTGQAQAPLLCIAGCAECCWKVVGQACQVDADCCSPLRCVSEKCQ